MKQNENALKQAAELEKKGYDPKYVMGRTGQFFKTAKNSTISAQSYREAHCKTSMGFGNSQRMSSAGIEDDKSITMQDLESKYQQSVRSRQISPARIKYDILSRQRCVSP